MFRYSGYIMRTLQYDVAYFLEETLIISPSRSLSMHKNLVPLYQLGRAIQSGFFNAKFHLYLLKNFLSFLFVCSRPCPHARSDLLTSYFYRIGPAEIILCSDIMLILPLFSTFGRVGKVLSDCLPSKQVRTILLCPWEATRAI